jgi:hypothetical protein
VSAAKERWHVALQDDDTREQWELDVVASPPMAQASAEVRAIKDAQNERPGHRIRCVFSRFVREEIT